MFSQKKKNEVMEERFKSMKQLDRIEFQNRLIQQNQYSNILKTVQATFLIINFISMSFLIYFSTAFLHLLSLGLYSELHRQAGLFFIFIFLLSGLIFVFVFLSCSTTLVKETSLNEKPIEEREIRVEVEKPAEKLAKGIDRAFNVEGQTEKNLDLGIIINTPLNNLKEKFTKALKDNLKDNYAIKDLESDKEKARAMDHVYLMKLAQEEDLDGIVVGNVKEKEKSFKMNSRIILKDGKVVGLPVIEIAKEDTGSKTALDILKKESPEISNDGVIFRYFNLSAKKVKVAGNFNEWNPEELQRVKNDDEICWITKKELKPGRYSYSFVVDGEWITDPLNASIVKSRSGETKSFLYVKK